MPELLTRRVGPFPVWAWLAIAVAGVVVGRAVSRMSGGGPAPARTDPATGQPFMEIPRAGGPDNSAPGSTGGGGSTDGPITTNTEWVRVASRRLRDTSQYGAAAVDQALRRYLEGQPLSQTQRAIVGAAIDAAGPPPEGAPSILDEPPPSAPPPSTKPPGTGSSTKPAPSADCAKPTGQTGSVPGDRNFTTPAQIRSRVAAIRSQRNLPADPASDAIWVDRIGRGSATIGDARTALERLAQQRSCI